MYLCCNYYNTDSVVCFHLSCLLRLIKYFCCFPEGVVLSKTTDTPDCLLCSGVLCRAPQRACLVVAVPGNIML